MEKSTFVGCVLFMNRYYMLLVSFCLLLASCDTLPDSDIVTDLPSYYDDYLDKRVDAINETIKECDGNSECFFWITDIHWEQDLNSRRSPAMIKYIADRTGVKRILNGGDTGNAQVICQNAIDRLRDAIGSNEVYSVNGNHEMTDASKYEKPFRRVDEELRGHCSNLVYGDDDRSYFYFDDSTQKTRYIGLSVFGLYRNGGSEPTLTAEQLAWFKNTALNVEDGWKIIVFAHSMLYVSDTSDKLSTVYSEAADFVKAIDTYNGKGKIICVLLGHTHRDRMHKEPNGVPYIISASDRYSPYYTNGVADINVDRVPGTITEQHFEVVVIDRKNKKVRLFAIGGQARDGYDDEPGNCVDERVVTYE